LRVSTTEDRLVLLDTAGYADDGATPAQLREMQEALRDADLVLLVMDAASPARREDAKLLDELTAWLQAKVQRKPPPVLGVLTHIDQLRPTLEWTPPCAWRQPSRPKEHSIAGAVAYTREQFGSLLADVVPVCTDVARQRAWGAYEELLPVMLGALGDARACALLRTLHAELDARRVQLLFQQLGHAGTELLRGYLTRLTESTGRY
jgi:predicted GTPase